MAQDRFEKLVQAFPIYASGVVELGTLVVSELHDPDLQKTQNKASVFLEGAYAEARSTSKSLEGAVSLEAFMRQALPTFIEQIHDPDKAITLSRCQEAKEAMPELAAKYAKEQVAQRKPFWRRWSIGNPSTKP